MIVDAVLIAGPTASGKSAAALALAERIGGALINTDSMQVYREARIVTSRPDEMMLARARHFLYGHVGVREPYSVARYQSEAVSAMKEARAQALVPIFVGGTGLYFGALTEGLSEIPPVPASLRQSMRARHGALGAEAFYVDFAARDPVTASRLRASDTQRVLRAAEVFEASGRPLAEWQQRRGPAPLCDFQLARFVLAPPRAELYRRIGARFDLMIEDGALDEAARLKGLDPVLPSSRILGLRELLGYLDGRADLETAKSAAKTATRQYAKRQLTWFRRRMADWIWIEQEETRDVLVQMLEQLRRS